MKLKTISSMLALTALSTLNSQLSTTFAQGSLTPPAGAPAAVMKSLDQIEARTPISSVPFSITQNGSYYFTTNLSHTALGQNNAITVGNCDATIDMNGFTLTLATNNITVVGFSLQNQVGHQVRICNGHIIGAGTNVVNGQAGIVTLNAGNVVCENVHCYNLSEGINLESNAGRNIVRNCSVERSGYVGIVADVVEDCVVQNTVSYGIEGGSVSDCVVKQDAGFNGVGIRSFGYAAVSNCEVLAQGGGISSAASVINSYASSVSSTAIQATVVQNCVASRTSGTAIQATVANGCYATAGTNIITYKYNMP